MKRAEEVGDAKAAEEAGVSRSTVGRWRFALAGRGEAGAVASEVPFVEPEAEEEGLSALDAMRRAAAKGRELERLALAETEALLRARRPSEARNSATVAGILSDKSLAREKAIVAAEGEEREREARLGQGRLEMLAALLRALFEGLALPPPLASMRELAECAAAGGELVISEAVAAEDRRAVRAVIEAEVRPAMYAEVHAEVLAELEANGAVDFVLEDAGEDDEDEEAEERARLEELHGHVDVSLRSGFVEQDLERWREAGEQREREGVDADEVDELWSHAPEAQRVDLLREYQSEPAAKRENARRVRRRQSVPVAPQALGARLRSMSPSLSAADGPVRGGAVWDHRDLG